MPYRCGKNVSIEKKTKEHAVGRLSQLVHTIEKINANPDDNHSQATGGEHKISVHHHGTSGSRGSSIVGQANDKAVVGDPEAANEREEDSPVEITDDELCFKVAQLVTELLLMLFAASLLCIATIVIVTRKTPAIMESYDIIPKILFILCIIVATGSFLRWIFTKFQSLCDGHKKVTKTTTSQQQSFGKVVDEENKGGTQEEQMSSQFKQLQVQEQASSRGARTVSCLPMIGTSMATSILGDFNKLSSSSGQPYISNKPTTVVSSDGYHSCSNKIVAALTEVSISSPRRALLDLRFSGQSSKNSPNITTPNDVIDEESTSMIGV